MNKDILKPCPFCGRSGVVTETHKDHWVIMCFNEQCGCKITVPEDNIHKAWSRWNTRATPPIHKWTAEELLFLAYPEFAPHGHIDAFKRLSEAINAKNNP